MRCGRCGGDLTFTMQIVKEGRVYDCWRCLCELRVMGERSLPSLGREIQKRDNVLMVRLKSRNVFLFDRRLFHEFMRQIFRELREQPLDVLLNLEEVGYLPDMFFKVIVRLNRFLDSRGRKLRIVNSSAIFRHTLAGERVDPEKVLFGSETEALLKMGGS